MTGDELLDWVEQNRASVWPSKDGTRYTLFARQAGELPIQPTDSNAA
jgi:hypothetical protein